jgi:excinuclease ABC subunit C
VQEDAPGPDESGKLDEAAVFLLERGRIVGPERLSTLGVRAVREQTAVGSSLFAQPLMLAAVPLEDAASQQVSESASQSGAVTLSPEDRAQSVLARLEALAAEAGEPELAVRGDFLALFRRWYYRPEKQRAGEVFLPAADGGWPVRRILNGAARVVLGPARELPRVDREAAAGMKTKVIHPGRDGVERVVPVLPKRSRKRKVVSPEGAVPGCDGTI